MRGLDKPAVEISTRPVPDAATPAATAISVVVKVSPPKTRASR